MRNDSKNSKDNAIAKTDGITRHSATIETVIHPRPVYGAMIVRDTIISSRSVYGAILLEEIPLSTTSDYGATLEEVSPVLQPPLLSYKKEYGPP